jgi:hypothetical protein
MIISALRLGQLFWQPRICTQAESFLVESSFQLCGRSGEVPREFIAVRGRVALVRRHGWSRLGWARENHHLTVHGIPAGLPTMQVFLAFAANILGEFPI